MKNQQTTLTSRCPLCGSKPSLAKSKAELGGPLMGCETCRWQWIGTPLTAELADRIYNGKNYHSVWSLHSQESEEPDFVRSTKVAIAKQIISKLGSLKGKSVLEVGCAGGLMLEQFQKYGASTVYGVELGTTAAQVAKRRLGDDKVWNGTIETCPNKALFDLVIAVDLIEHVADPQQTLQEFKSRLNSRGQIILVLPDLKSFSARLMGSRWTEYKEEHRYYFTGHSMGKLAQKSGLQLSRWQGFTKSMTLPYLFHTLAHFAPGGPFKKMANGAARLTNPLKGLPLPLPSGNALAILEM